MLKKMTVVSNKCCFGPLPEQGDEIVQKFTLNSKGQVWLSVSNFGEDYIICTTGRKVRKNVAPEAAEKIMNDVFGYAENRRPYYVTDCGDYDLYLFFDDGTKKHYHGPLFYDTQQLADICNEIRTVTEIDNLFLMDGGDYGFDEDSEED